MCDGSAAVAMVPLRAIFSAQSPSQYILVCAQHAQLSPIGICFRMEHLTELSGDHTEISSS